MPSARGSSFVRIGLTALVLGLLAWFAAGSDAVAGPDITREIANPLILAGAGFTILGVLLRFRKAA